MASIRIQILQVIRDAVDAVLSGGCDMPRRRGLNFARCSSSVPMAVVYPQDDSPQGGETRVDGGIGRGGTQLRTVTAVVDVYIFDPDAPPVSEANPTGEDPSLVEILDEHLAVAETAIKALWITEPPTELGTTWRDLGAAGLDPSVGIVSNDEGRLVCGRITFDVRYRCAERDPAEAV